ncbi:MAG: EAL domain-containing protein [Oscillatoria sp. PMC 1068.18]|nr:EAL domain-containing protein [Oscillatoria sp. PMC 1076.18]MEC4990306.1 EAL domain-containing protein [Oscillatoria sp. PMC 1068.18]
MKLKLFRDRSAKEVIALVQETIASEQVRRKQAESESKLRNLIDSLPGIVFSCINDGKWSRKYFSEKVFNLTGYRAVELTTEGKIAYNQDLIHAEDLAKVFEKIETAIAAQEGYEVEYRITTKTGEQKWFRETGRGNFSSSGELIEVEGFITEITQEKQAEQTSLAREERSRILAENSSEMISRHQINGVCLDVSPTCKTLLGYEPAELIGRSFWELFHPQDLELIQQYQTQLLEDKTSNKTITYRIQHQSGKYIWLETNIKKIGDRSPENSHIEPTSEIIAISRDISRRKQAENLLASQKQVLETIASEASLADTLKILVQSIEANSDGLLGSICVVTPQENYLQIIAAPSLPKTYIQAAFQIPISPNAASCGTAAYYQKPVIVTDIASDPLWENYRNLALSHGLQACWSTPISSNQGKILGTFAIYYRHPCIPTSQDWQLLEDVTNLIRIAIERKQAETALRVAEAKYRTIFENITQGIFQTLPNGSYLSANPALANIYGYNSPAELIESLTNIDAQLYVDPHRRAYFTNLMEKYGQVLAFESEVYRQDGSKIWISENARAVKNENGEILYYEGTVEDITARRFAEEQLIYEATHDSLTGLHNREWFMKQLKYAIELARLNQDYFYALLFIDLDRFKVVNDSLGHPVGDELLKSFAAWLQSSLPTTKKIARLGGDEFAILLEGIEEFSQAIQIAELIEARLKEPFQLHNYEVFTGASIGISLSSFAYQQPEDLLRDADVAMYQAKVRQLPYEVFNPAMQIDAMARMELENDLRRALEREEFCLYYQPIIKLTTKQIVGFEALVRWHHPTRGLILPDEFIPVAEEMGLIESLGWWVLREACQQLAEWQQQGELEDLLMNVNLAGVQFKQVNFCETVEEICSHAGINSDCLKLEITESSFLETIGNYDSTIRQIKAKGIKLCIDDFGTGYSSLSRLHEFPIDTLKIDRSFLSRLGAIDSDSGIEIVRTIMMLAQNLGMDVVAEGVETKLQREKLQELGCELAQGYLFSHPVDSLAAGKLIARGEESAAKSFGLAER